MTPLAEPMVATPVELLLQVPPEVVQFSVVVVPMHTLAAPVIDAAMGFTLTTTVAVFVQPLALAPATVYVVVTVGFAVGPAHAVHDSAVAGAHV